jgi:acetyl-CoA carboxylase carboxyltransferase component
MATGEVSDDETLGGAEMHAKISGLADYMVDNELQAIDKGASISLLPRVHLGCKQQEKSLHSCNGARRRHCPPPT